MLFHLDLYQLADFIGCKGLKKLAEMKFESAAKQDWQDDEFVTAVEKVYDITSANENGRKLREVAVEIAADHLRTLCEHDTQFVEMMASVPSFSADVAMALVGVLPGDSSNREMKTFFCRECKFNGQFQRDLSFISSTCPSCHETSNILTCDKINRRRKTLTCTKQSCSFQSHTEVWQDLDQLLRCPMCATTAKASEWENASKLT